MQELFDSILYFRIFGITILEGIFLGMIIYIIILRNGGYDELKDKLLRKILGVFKGSVDPDSVVRSLSRLKITPYQIKSERTVEGLVVEHLKKGFKKKQFPVSEKYGNCSLSLPVYPDLQVKKVAEICKLLKSFIKKN